MDNLKKLIETSFDERDTLDLSNPTPELHDAIQTSIEMLDSGAARVAEPTNTGWQVNEWLKKAVLLFFATEKNQTIQTGHTNYFDKVPLKFSDWTQQRFAESGIRVVPDAGVRKGAYIARNVVLMPSYINIGAYVDSGTLVDTWATVGSCAQIGKNVHLSGGVGIGGVLEPLQASPTIIEDNCFIGARSEIVEGVIVEEGAVISMGVYIGQSTRIYDREKDKVLYGRVPAGAVVVPGSLPSSTGNCSLYAAIIVKRVDAKTRAKTGINELLRED
ncbi:MAG: 2,3,4,5-tetrahydropyridine-2,6-dicarboxylate N-succinyltransferase [Gammaproteobacteria bacterium]|nr:2,3,4,5-tetrahydropyridine-2,6-dicarboxylate N-succinyltransferase [Gammaproteobacteria bacterium]MCP4088845.1 2,3,4,5-tetrahydropyridine-2,6-dicarboxylate N-succinyltransferase [Gammaproteobacteria bacterium]MCP4274861.1 2,3,4,5-tetrahydropyridine-2,6-dicarboxylate N-succinyltransferase [Gammaproteobacteria bacterium]MCP4832072.1 2,3,4,5-tetrahydropyridine-2,6-dicarboxylate N-succinyltransferase [Gammaproteobacteria bacterium]MCP4928327.1 2,3,4,5-tetrahydropyridine-2,6-dicarboxylate N-succi